MPGTKRKTSSKNKSTNKKSNSSYRQPVLYRNWSRPSVVPFSKTRTSAVLIYYENGLSINPALASIGLYRFNLSGLFDPNFTGAGHQPRGFDQYMTLYEQYCVYGAKYRVGISSTDATVRAVCGVTINDSNSNLNLSTDQYQFVENGNTQWQLLGNAASGADIAEFSGYVDIAKVHGLNKNDLLKENSYKGTNAANPTEGVYLDIWVGPQDGAADVGTYPLLVEIQYYTWFLGNTIAAVS